MLNIVPVFILRNENRVISFILQQHNMRLTVFFFKHILMSKCYCILFNDITKISLAILYWQID